MKKYLLPVLMFIYTVAKLIQGGFDWWYLLGFVLSIGMTVILISEQPHD